eukprot:5672875-Amphidinium_carterae.1
MGADAFLHLVAAARDKAIAFRLGSLALALTEAVNCCQHAVIADDTDARLFLHQCALRAKRRHAARLHPK